MNSRYLIRIEVTKKEKKILDWIVSEMYAERGFSDINYTDAIEAGFELTIYRGVLSSLVKKGLISIDSDYQDLIYLTETTEGMVKSWLEKGAEKPVILKVK